MGFEHGRRAGYGQNLEIGIIGSDFGIKRQPSSRECPQGSLGRGRCRENGPWPEGSQVADRRHLTDDSVERDWRKAAGALMMMVLSVTTACVRLFTAVSRATFRCRIISTELSADLGRAFA